MAVRKYVTVAGAFRTRAEAERAVRDLRRAGFRGGQVQVHAGAAPATSPPAPKKRTKAGPADAPAAEGVVPGGVAGGVIGAAAAAIGLIRPPRCESCRKSRTWEVRERTLPASLSHRCRRCDA